MQQDLCSVIHKQMTLMVWFFLVTEKYRVLPMLSESPPNDSYCLVNQKHTARPLLLCDSQANDSHERILFSESKT